MAMKKVYELWAPLRIQMRHEFQEKFRYGGNLKKKEEETLK